MNEFDIEILERTRALSRDKNLNSLSSAFLENSIIPKYSYNFKCLGRPIIQYPQDMVATQELIWKVKPDLIIETGVAHGGSLVMSAACMAMLDVCEAIKLGKEIDPALSRRRVIGIDIDIRSHSRKAIENHPMSSRIELIQGSSTDAHIISTIKQKAKAFSKVMVFLDSNHTHEHVLSELRGYCDLVSIGSYCIVFDTYIDDVPKELFPDRPWGPGNNPKTAVREFLNSNPQFEVDKSVEDKLMITVCPSGYLRRTK